ncbi:MAG: branched-chain amino acid transport system II carrier protein, partial [Streptococcus sp.]|nr:branched-chain amino acid transport system II carrier protein [Streptococcus sp.]
RLRIFKYATAFTLIGFAIANLGLDAIIKYSIPVLVILYPITIAIVMIVIVNKFVALSKPGMQLTIGLVTAIALASVLGSSFKIEFLENLINALPFASASLPWLVPAIIGILLSLFLPNKQESDVFEME